MSVVGRRVLAITVGLALAVVMLAMVFRDALGVVQHLDFGLANKVGGHPIYRRFGNLMIHMSYLMMTMALAISTALLMWEHRQRKTIQNAVFIVLLCAVLQLSVTNYLSGYWFVPAEQQAILDLVLIFITSLCLSYLWRFDVVTESGSVLRVMGIVLLAYSGLVIPMCYFFLWSLVVLGAIDTTATRIINPAWISAAAGIGSFVLGAVKFWTEKFDREQGRDKPSKIILPLN